MLARYGSQVSAKLGRASKAPWPERFSGRLYCAVRTWTEVPLSWSESKDRISYFEHVKASNTAFVLPLELCAVVAQAALALMPLGGEVQAKLLS